MGEIIHTKNLENGEIIYKILLENEEIANLKGNLKNVHVFSSSLCTEDSQINHRGNKGVTKYFKIPLSLRSRKKLSGQAKYQKIETASKIFYIYTLEK
jgi:hypothetical protein